MQRFILSILTGLWGSAVLAAMGLGAPVSLQLCTLGGSALAGLVLAPLLARPGPVWPPLATLLTTLAGAALAGLAFAAQDIGGGNPLGGLLLGPSLVLAAILSSPVAAIAWFAGALALPLAARAMQA